MNDLNIAAGTNISERFKYDPLHSKQVFPAINIRLHCCHYWMILQWECNNLASPFWRLYYNTKAGASVMYNGLTTALNGTKILLIPPNTAFSTRLAGHYESIIHETHTRKKITRLDILKQIENSKASDHLFIHFNLGLPFDLLEPGIYTFPVQEKEEQLLNQIKDYCIAGHTIFNFTTCAAINALILCMLDEVPQNRWEMPKIDKRVTDGLCFIEQQLDKRITNRILAVRANMAENSYARLFKENTGVSIQQYIKKKKIDKAVILLHHTDSSIEVISNECGFSDRHHFSRAFKEIKETTPALYRRRVNIFAKGDHK